jgi:archaellum biogenesis ATPase FlaH
MVDAVIEGIKDRVSVAIKVNQSVGIQVPENRHDDLLEALFNFMLSNPNDVWTFVTASDTYDHISKIFKEISEHSNIKFIDCISRAAGISELQGNCRYIESPTMLEIASLEIMNNFRGVDDKVEKYVIIDSLSALMIYNDSEIIREFASLLTSRTRAKNIHIVTIIIEEEVDSNKLIQMNDKIVVLRDSFIE